VGNGRLSGSGSVTGNVDPETIDGFGREWVAFDQTKLTGAEFDLQFNGYFGIFPFDELPPGAEGFDLGCGSGRWAAAIAPRVAVLNCIDPSAEALDIARKRLSHLASARFHLASSDTMPLADSSQDFGYSVGVLHHIPDTAAALRDCVGKLKPGAPFLLYVYYAFDNRPSWYRQLWRVSDFARRAIARLPFALRHGLTTAIAIAVYWPLARFARAAERMGANVSHFPLASYRRRSFYSMRTDALDRFGTKLEQRFSREQIRQMMEAAGLEQIRFSDDVPYWTACGRRAAGSPPRADHGSDGPSVPGARG
jgi:ubiquinone/menaquinone biosynthesis C-methylase UbiE